MSTITLTNNLFTSVMRGNPATSRHATTTAILDQVTEQGEKAVSYTWGLTNIIAGALMGVSSSLSASLAKDSTAMDYVAKGGIVGSVIFVLVGLYKIVQTSNKNKQITNEPERSVIPVAKDETSRGAVYRALTDLKASPNNGENLLKPQSPTNDPYSIAPANFCTLKAVYESREKELQGIGLIPIEQENNPNSKTKYLLSGLLEDKDATITLTDVLDQQALMYSYMTSAYGINDELPALNKAYMPTDFNNARDAMENFARVSDGNGFSEDRLNHIFDHSSVDFARSAEVSTYASNIAVANNSIKALKKILGDVLSGNDSREINLYRAALISTGIRARSVNELNDALRAVLTEVNKADVAVTKLVEAKQKEFTAENSEATITIENFSEFGIDGLIQVVNKPIS